MAPQDPAQASDRAQVQAQVPAMAPAPAVSTARTYPAALQVEVHIEVRHEAARFNHAIHQKMVVSGDQASVNGGPYVRVVSQVMGWVEQVTGGAAFDTPVVTEMKGQYRNASQSGI